MRHRKPRTLPLGSVSTGTMRPEDLIPAFLDVVDGLSLSRADRAKVRAIRRDYDRAEQSDAQDGEPTSYYQQDADDELSDLFDLLDRYTPDYCYFGAHSGDGADYGVWPSWESIDTAVHDRDIHKGGCLPSASYRSITYDPPNHALVVTDHGNCTLYRRAGNRWMECWAVV